MALTIHFLLSQVQIDFFKRSIPETRNLPKALTIDIIAPKGVIKPPLSKKPAEKAIETEKTNPRPETKPTTKKEKNIKTREQTTEDRTAKEDRVLVAHTPAQDPIKEDVVSKEDNVPAQDELNTPANKDMSETATHKGSPDFPAFTQTSHTLPVYLENPAPEYPTMAKRRGYQGIVVLDVLVNKDGKAESVRLAKSSGHDILDRAAVKGVKEWLFHPAKEEKEPVDAWVKIPIKFQLE
jgi:protein TonB